MKIIYHSKFLKEYEKLPAHTQRLLEEKEMVFKNNPFNPQLKTHKLHGKFKGMYFFSINYNYRIIFEILKGEIFVFLLIGKHSIYK